MKDTDRKSPANETLDPAMLPVLPHDDTDDTRRDRRADTILRPLTAPTCESVIPPRVTHRIRKTGGEIISGATNFVHKMRYD